jgi:hypothetical protein
MILKFPDLNSLRLALITGAVPAGMSQAGAVAGFDDQDQCWVETSASLARSNQTELKKFGVQCPRTSSATLKTEVSCWAEILPLERDRSAIDHLEQQPVLFDLANGEELARLVIEVLRLGNDRQGFRWLEDNGDKEGANRALLRVVGPPYYSLLRAMDRIGGQLAPVAFVERQPRVWVELGYSHPLIGQIKPPQGRILMIRPPRQWTLLDDAPYRDVYEVLEFPLPDGKVGWKDVTPKDQKIKGIKVTPSLKPGGSPDGAELWVLRDNPIEELNYFVQNANDEMLQRLAFAVGDKGGKSGKTIVVRVRQSKQQPPVLVFKNAIAYKHYLKLPNLFLPAGTRLHPPLRRDQVRKLLADDTSQVVWLHPGENGAFTPESLPEDSFRPLWDWIDYVLDHEKEPLQAWVQAAQFDFEAFVCDEDPSTKPRKPPSNESKSKPRREGGSRSSDSADAKFVQMTEEPKAAEEKAPIDDFGSVVKVEPSIIQKQLKALEESFLAMEGGLDTPERQEMWPQLASLNTQLNTVDDAGVCWMNALWERDEQAARAWSWHWFVSEAAAVPTREEKPRSAPRSWVQKVTSSGGKVKEVPAEDLDRLLNQKEPATADLRALAAYITYAALQNPPSQALVMRLGQVSRFLETHEKLLPVRAVWLAWSYLTTLSRGDVLALARSRDRLLERLYNNGLRPEQDLPSFLRFAGQPTSQRFRAVRQWMTDLAGLAQDWIKEGGIPNATAQTPAYVDLVFAFGLARLGETDAARKLLGDAKGALTSKDDAHQFLLGAFEHRVKQALDNKPPTGPLPNDQLEYLEHMERLLRYVVDRLRKHSYILEPDQRINPYRHWGARISDFERALAELTDLTDRNELASRVDKLLREVPKGAKGNENRARVLRAGLEAAPRVGEDFARRMLDQTVAAYDALPEAKEMAALMDQATFLEKALFVAGHYGRTDSVHPLVTRFQRMLQGQKGQQALQALESLAKECFRGLRKLGMRDEIDAILRQMADLVLEGQEVKAIDFKKREQGATALRALLQVAAGWYFFGRDSQAEPILQAARGVLLAGDLPPREQTQLACSYAYAVGQAPVEVAQKRLEELFRQLKGIKDTYTTSSHFSVSQLDVVESVVRAVVSDEFTMGTQARRWLDDDEFLVRRRIHRDLRTVMEK